MKNKICIYCCGLYGIRTYLELKEYGIKADMFGDKDPSKQGYIIDDVYCKSYEEILLEEKNILIIVANENPDKLVAHFKGMGFKNTSDSRNAIKKLVKNKEKKTYEPISDAVKLKHLKEEISDGFYKHKVPNGIDDIAEIVNGYNKRMSK